MMGYLDKIIKQPSTIYVSYMYKSMLLGTMTIKSAILHLRYNNITVVL